MSEPLGLRKRLLIGYTIILFFVQWGLPLFYLLFSLNLGRELMPVVVVFFLIGVPVAGGIFNIYIPLRLLKTDASYPNKVIVSNALGVGLFYSTVIFQLRHTYSATFLETAKISFLALSVGILQCLSSFLFAHKSIYPYMERDGPKKRASLFYKNLLFIISLVILGVIIVGSVSFNELEQSVTEHGIKIDKVLLNVLMAFLIAIVVVFVFSYEFTRLINLPLKELADSAKAMSSGRLKRARAITGDELEDLANAFNLMVERVREREEELILKGQHLALLYSLAEALNQNKTRQEIFHLTMQWMETVFGFEVGAIRLLRDGSLKLIASKGIDKDIIKKIDMVRLGESISGMAAMKEDVVVVEDISEVSSPYAETAKALGLKCLLSIPLKSKEVLIGTLSIGSRFKRDIHPANIKMLNSISSLLGIAIERSGEFDRIEEEKFEWETAVSFIKDIISIHDTHWRIKKVNPAFLKHFGMKEHEVLGKHCYEVFHGMDMPPPECPMMETMVTRNKSNTTMETKDNKVIAIAVHPIHKTNGIITESIHIVRDVTELYRLRQHLHQADKMGALGRLTAGIAHNVNNPLTYSLNYLHILKYASDEKTKELIAKAEEGIRRSKDVLEGLLDFSSPSEGQIEAIDLEEIIKGIITFLSAELKEKNILIHTEFSAETKVKAHRKAIEEVLLNLLTNSIDSGATEITVEAYKDPEDITIVVTDNGSGIHKEHIPLIFEPYFSTKPKGKGTGLGLYISYNIIKSIGGDIWCQSHMNRGTQFLLHLPHQK